MATIPKKAQMNNRCGRCEQCGFRGRPFQCTPGTE